MFSKIRSLLKQSMVYGLGTIAARAVAFILLPYYSHLMHPAEYGIYTLFMILVAFLQPLFVHGMDISFLRFSAAVPKDQQNNDLGLILTHTTIIGLIIGVPIYLLAPEIARLVVNDAGAAEITLTRISIGILILDTLANHMFTFLRIRNRAMTFSIFKLANVAVNIGLNVYFVGKLHLGPTGAFYAFIITSALTLVSLTGLLYREIRVNWSWQKVKPWLEFGLPNVPAMVFVMVIGFSDRKWLEHYLGLEQAGLYSAGYRIGMLMNMLVQAFRYAWQPFFLQTAEDDDAKETFSRVMTYFIAVAGWVWLASALLLKDIFKIHLPGIGPLIDERYWQGLDVFPVIMLGHIFAGVYANLMVGVYIEKKTKVIPLIVGVSALVNIIGNWLLIPHYGYWASAWIMVLSNAIVTILMYVYIIKRYPVKYEWDRMIRICITVFVAWGFSVVISDAFSLTGVILWILNTGIVLCTPLIWWGYVLTSDEKNGLYRYLQRRKS
ncbi:MAG: polysaccharide biosynthesis C-terminal domain-containing protein [Candidatus Electryonea clarkiae]|nr:polysaccharide biosynthesis C-terminal domain-containing protein [Candidatus Electryonea clarkiae]MDP8286084.1 polysaccharide biosynthesis C-terminal domain-containing protein [Candidatus Electryonea clarkiae]